MPAREIVMTFWIAAAVLTALAATLMAQRAASAARRGPEDPAVGVYRQQLLEVEDLARRGLLDEEDRRQAAAEAGRRLLEAHAAPSAPIRSSRAAGRTPAVAAGAAALAAVGLYLLLGSPGAPDAPFRDRLEQWRGADPRTLDAPRMAALLQAIVAERPRDPEPLTYLGQARAAAGDPYGAVEAFKRASALSPRDTRLLILLGQAQASAAKETGLPDQADDTFRRVLVLAPGDPAARYFLARSQIARGQTAEGLAVWRALRAELPPADPRRAELDARIAEAEAEAQPLSPAGRALAEAAPADQTRMIEGMVDGLAARLSRNPDDPAGWARLIRAYGVLGRDKAQADAIAKARTLFAGRSADLALIEAEARP